MAVDTASNRLEKRKQRTRRLLQQAALELITAHGYDAVAIQDITDHADVGRATFYLHYRDKDDLFWSIIQADFDAVNADILRYYQGEASPHLEYLIWIRMFEYAAQKRDFFLILLQGKGAPILTERIETYFLQLMEAGVKSGRFFPQLNLDPVIVAEFWVGVLIRMLKWWLITAPDYTPQQVADQLYQIMFPGANPPTAFNEPAP